MIGLEPLSVEAVRYVVKRLRPQDKAELPRAEQLLADAATADGGWAIVKDGAPLAVLVGKRNPEHQDMVHAWALMTEKARGNGKALLRLTRQGIEKEGARLQATLFITFCRETRRDQDKWVRAVGFKPAPEGNYTQDGIKWKGYCYGLRRQG